MPDISDPSLTRALAEKVMGWREHKEGSEYKDSESPAGTYLVVHGNVLRFDHDTWVEWRPLVSMDDAMMIVEHLRIRTTGSRYWCEMRTPWMDEEGLCPRYRVSFTAWGFTGWNGRPDYWALADSLERAIVLAALKVQEGR